MDTVPEYITVLRENGFSELVDALLVEAVHTGTNRLNRSALCRHMGKSQKQITGLLARARTLLESKDINLTDRDT